MYLKYDCSTSSICIDSLKMTKSHHAPQNGSLKCPTEWLSLFTFYCVFIGSYIYNSIYPNTDVLTRTIHDFWMLKSWFKIYFDAPQNDDFVNAGITEKSSPKFFNNF